jgi:hypothetical protein
VPFVRPTDLIDDRRHPLSAPRFQPTLVEWI